MTESGESHDRERQRVARARGGARTADTKNDSENAAARARMPRRDYSIRATTKQSRKREIVARATICVLTK
jgi:hypothetical protein